MLGQRQSQSGVLLDQDHRLTLSMDVSDDGSNLFIGNEKVVDNDGLHGAKEVEGLVALGAGWHKIQVSFFEKTGGDVLKVKMAKAGKELMELRADQLFWN